MPKKAGMEDWKKQRRQEYLETKNTDTTFFVKESRQNRSILLDLSV